MSAARQIAQNIHIFASSFSQWLSSQYCYHQVNIDCRQLATVFFSLLLLLYVVVLISLQIEMPILAKFYSQMENFDCKIDVSYKKGVTKGKSERKNVWVNVCK